MKLLDIYIYVYIYIYNAGTGEQGDLAVELRKVVEDELRKVIEDSQNSQQKVIEVLQDSMSLTRLVLRGQLRPVAS